MCSICSGSILSTDLLIINSLQSEKTMRRYIRDRCVWFLYRSINRLSYLAAFALFAILTELEVNVFLFYEIGSLIDMRDLRGIVVNGLVLEKLNLVHHLIVTAHRVAVSGPATLLGLLRIKKLINVVAN